MRINFAQQFKHYGNIILMLILIFNIAILAVWGISYANSLPVEYLLEDPASLIGYNQFIGFITPIGAIVLAISIGAALLMAFILPSQPDLKRKKEVSFILIMALISFFLILDDLFLLHERVFTGWFQVGERRIFLVYILLFTVFLITYKESILTGPIIFLIIAGLMFGLSLAADFVSDKVPLREGYRGIIEILEEGGKLGGYLFWTTYVLIKAKICIVDAEN